MKFKAYILEATRKYGEGRTKHIDEEEAIKLTASNCKRNFKQLYSEPQSGPRIYRGLDYNDSYGLVDTNTVKPRRSANTKNFMTLLMDNLPSWKGFPKRSKGLICATDYDIADGYGGVYNVIPYDNCLIGVCPNHDVWQSFRYGLAGLGGVNSFNMSLHGLFSNNDIDVDDRDYKSFINGLKELVILIDKDQINKQDYTVGEDFIFNMLKKGKNDIEKHFNKMFDPNENGFKIGIDNLKHTKEVWIQGKCILFDYNFTQKVFLPGVNSLL